MEEINQKICIAILNWNGYDWLKKNLSKIIKYSNKAKVVVIDNNSTDKSVSYVKSNYKSVELISNPKNYGFSKGYNSAIKKINFDFLLLINNDVEVTKDYIKPLYKFLVKNKEFAAVQPKILDGNNKNKFEYSGAAGGYIDYFGIPFCKGRIGNVVEKDKGLYNKDSTVFWCSGACFLIRRKDFLKVGGFDEDFFMHQEEIDLCWRIQGLNKKIGYTYKSKVFHYGGGSLKTGNWKKNYFNHRNNLLMLFKNLPLIDLIIIIINRAILDVFISINHLLKFKLFNFFSIYLAYASFIIMLPKFIHKRKPINTKFYGKYNIHIIFLYLIRRKKKFYKIFN